MRLDPAPNRRSWKQRLPTGERWVETAQLETAPTKHEERNSLRGDHNLTDRVTKAFFRHFLCQSVRYGYPSRAVSALSRFISQSTSLPNLGNKIGKRDNEKVVSSCFPVFFRVDQNHVVYRGVLRIILSNPQYVPTMKSPTTSPMKNGTTLR